MGVRAAVTISVAAAAACAVALRRRAPAPGASAAELERPAGDPLLEEIHRALSELSRPELFALARSRGLRVEELFDLTAEQLAGEIDRIDRVGR